MLTLAPILARYLACVVMPRRRELAFVRSMLAVLQVVELLQAVRRRGVTPEALQVAIEGHLALFAVCWGVNLMRPKQHYALHLPGMLRRFGLLLSTLTMERRHRAVKRHTRPRQNARKWDLSVVEEVTAHHLWELEGSSGSRFLTGRTGAAPRHASRRCCASLCQALSSRTNASCIIVSM